MKPLDALLSYRRRQSSSKTDAKLLFVDIETAPSLGWVWAKWETNVIDFKSDWYVLSFAYKWAGEKKVTVKGLDDYAGYAKDKENDKALMQDLWDLLNEADIVVGHNGDKFDIPKVNTRFLTHKMEPPRPFKTVDTLKIARNIFKFDSNKLDDLGRYLGIGRKVHHTGFNLWKGCMDGDKTAWKTMKEYNGHDVELLEKLYYLLRSWHTQHPNVNQTLGVICPKCGGTHITKQGYRFTALRKKARYQCQTCAGWFEGSATIKG